MKYPIGIQSFERIIEGGYVYVDKTELIYRLENYYQGRKELFRGLAMELLEKDWYVYPVFHVDFNGGNYTNAGELENKLRFYISEWERQYGLSDREKELGLGDRFAEVLRAAHEESGRRAVVLIDEYDKPILDVLDVDTALEDRHRNVLKGFYSVQADTGCARCKRRAGRPSPERTEGLLFGIQGCRPPPAVRTADRGDKVLSGECFQRLQPARRHQHEHGLRVSLRHNPG